ncbi:AAA family ATPase, partial [Helicobacter ganmani]|uniref:AAA family ATPase n=7 Tax=Helicobacteraceae TaxID=72293 RepID=UPI003A85E476
MIQSIIIKNVASYNEAKLEPLKKINLIYGLNGAGKTILSNYLKYRENESFKE